MPTRTKTYLNSTPKANKINLKPKEEKHPGYAMNKWKQYSYIFRSQNPECNECKEIYNPKQMVVDHIIPVRYGGSFNDSRNHQSLCGSCHSKKTVKEKKRPLKESMLNEFGELIPKQ